MYIVLIILLIPIYVGDLETAEEKYETAKKELEATLTELAEV